MQLVSTWRRADLGESRRPAESGDSDGRQRWHVCHANESRQDGSQHRRAVGLDHVHRGRKKIPICWLGRSALYFTGDVADHLS